VRVRGEAWCRGEGPGPIYRRRTSVRGQDFSGEGGRRRARASSPSPAGPCGVGDATVHTAAGQFVQGGGGQDPTAEGGELAAGGHDGSAGRRAAGAEQ
jgi:hypothetical protein